MIIENTVGAIVQVPRYFQSAPWVMMYLGGETVVVVAPATAAAPVRVSRGVLPRVVR